MSHEIRTPLNGILGFGQLMTQTSLTHVQQNYITSMNRCSIQLMQIINDILDFSKLSSGKMSINTECFTVDELYEHVKSVMTKRIKDKRQTLDLQR